MRSRADAVVHFLSEVFGRPVPIRIRMWDGSVAGPADGVAVTLRRREALRHILRAPGELGVARAYVTGALAVEGDIEESLATVFAALSGSRPKLDAGTVGRGLRLFVRLGALGLPPRRPLSEARVRGRLHSARRDAEVIRHHYDVSNDFYALLLDSSMAYSCAHWTSDEAQYTLADAQRDKLDLIGRKLALGPGVRLLDIGCGWGSLTVHAARNFGAAVTAVTVSKAQHAFVAKRLADEGVSHLVDLRLCDYREVLAQADRSFDAVAVVEMGEHVGDAEYPAFVSGLHTSLRAGGRLLVQVMSRGDRHPGGGPFIERYIAPDMHMRPLHETIRLLAQGGFEVREVEAMREDYARTIRAWRGKLEDGWEQAVAMIGEEGARVWRLYLAGGALSFEQGRMGVDQILLRA